MWAALQIFNEQFEGNDRHVQETDTEQDLKMINDFKRGKISANNKKKQREVYSDETFWNMQNKCLKLKLKSVCEEEKVKIQHMVLSLWSNLILNQYITDIYRKKCRSEKMFFSFNNYRRYVVKIFQC